MQTYQRLQNLLLIGAGGSIKKEDINSAMRNSEGQLKENIDMIRKFIKDGTNLINQQKPSKQVSPIPDECVGIFILLFLGFL